MGMIEDIYLYLTTGTGAVASTRCFINLLPSEPDAAVVLIETLGLPSDRVMGRNLPAYQRARIQVLTRGSTNGSYAARQTAEAVWTQLIKVGNSKLAGASSGFTYATIDDVQSPQLAGRDERGRPLFTCNFDVWPLR